MPSNKSFVETIKERCRVCYTCVRECPAKAIRISDGQAEIIGQRCINCGNCVRVCSQRAKQVIGSIGEVRALLDSGAPTAVCLAPSFPAEFTDISAERLVGMLRRLGFSKVAEVAAGADLVADAYRKLLAKNDGRRYIATTCPAVVTYVERYHPQLVDHLAPIVSPMIATARCLRRLYGPELRVVFVGPCIAKKQESHTVHVGSEMDGVLTFVELWQMFAEAGIKPESAEPGEFDPPRAGSGALFSISRGLLQAAAIGEDLIAGQVIAADGRSNFADAIKEFEAGTMDARLLETLCCTGCIMGAGMSSTLPLFARRARISEYVRARLRPEERRGGPVVPKEFEGLDLSRGFAPNDQRIPVPSPEEMTSILARMGKLKPEDELNCGACGYDTCREHATAIHRALAESEMCLPYTIDQLRKTVKELGVSNEQLAKVQEALMHTEKLASMGQLAAGIAHEMNNPLGVVLMYAHLLLSNVHDAKLREDLTLIADQADRCKKIVSGLLHFARQNKIVPQPTDLRELVDRNVKAIHFPANITVRFEHLAADTVAEVDPDQVVQILINLVTNAQAAMPDGGTLTLRTDGDERTVRLIVSDTGVGIPKENLRRIFEPFFTTKQIGRGTGLGLSVTYGIVKMHRGDIRVESNANPAAGPTGSTFTVILPRREKEE